MATYQTTEDELVGLQSADRRVRGSSCTNTTIDIQDPFDEDGEIDNISDGGRITDDGPKSLKEPPASPPHLQALYFCS